MPFPFLALAPIVLHGARLGVSYAVRRVGAQGAVNAARATVAPYGQAASQIMVQAGTRFSGSIVGRVALVRLPSGVAIPFSGMTSAGVSAFQEGMRHGFTWEAMRDRWDLRAIAMDGAVGAAVAAVFILPALQHRSWLREYAIQVAVSGAAGVGRSIAFTGDAFDADTIAASVDQAPLIYMRKKLLQAGGQLLFGDPTVARTPMGILFNQVVSFGQELAFREFYDVGPGRGPAGAPRGGERFIRDPYEFCLCDSFEDAYEAGGQCIMSEAASWVPQLAHERTEQLRGFLHRQGFSEGGTRGVRDSRVTRSFQRWLHTANPEIIVDGAWDRRTHAAYQQVLELGLLDGHGPLSQGERRRMARHGAARASTAAANRQGGGIAAPGLVIPAYR